MIDIKFKKVEAACDDGTKVNFFAASLSNGGTILLYLGHREGSVCFVPDTITPQDIGGVALKINE